MAWVDTAPGGPHMNHMALSVIHLLAQDEDVPVEARGALAEGRPEEAGRILMERFELSCEEASTLVSARVCND
jgi:hypothetical protein